jgi:hypothetical protein
MLISTVAHMMQFMACLKTCNVTVKWTEHCYINIGNVYLSSENPSSVACVQGAEKLHGDRNKDLLSRNYMWEMRPFSSTDHQILSD